MDDSQLSELEVAAPSAVSQAAHDFAQALASTSQFQALEKAADQLAHDEAAQRAVQAYQAKQESLRVVLMLNAVPPEELSELERLRTAFLSEPSVLAYLEAQEAVTALCQSAAALLSQQIGISYAAACGQGCC